MSKKPSPGLYGVIDIGTKTVKAIVIEVNNNSQRLLNIDSVELAAFDTFTDEEKYNDQISEAISKLADNLNLHKCKKIISLFYNRELQVKLIDFPNTVGVDHLNQVLPWEAKKLLSPHYKEEEYTYSYCITRGNPLSIALAVVPLPLLKNHLNLFNKTGIKPDSVYTDVFATLALQPIIDLAGLPALSVVNFGYSGTHLNIFSAGKLKFYRYIPTGSSEMTNPPRENELEMYSQKIRFSFDYFRAVSKLNQVDALFFMGGGTAIPNVLNYEQNYFSPTRISALDVSSKIDISPVMSANLIGTASQENANSISCFIPAIGACFADFREDSENMDLLNLIKQQEKEKNLEKLANTVPVFLGLISIILASFFLYYLYTEKKDLFANLAIELKDKDKQLNEYKKDLDNKKGSEKVNPIRLCPKSLDFVKQMIVSKNSLHNLFDVIDKEKPKNVQIKEILIRNHQEASQIYLKSKEELERENFDSDIIEEDNPKIKPKSSKKESSDIYSIFTEDETDETEKTDKIVFNSKPLVYESKLSTPITEQQIQEDFEGKVVIIHGFAEKATDVSEFSDTLSINFQDSNDNYLPSAIKRYIGINLRENENKIEFLLKGEIK